MLLKVTVTQMSHEPERFAQEWEQLVAHVHKEQSQLVLLPEMPFSPWFGSSPDFDPARWQAAVAMHDQWMQRLPELAPALVLGSRPINRNGRRFNEGFLWEPDSGYHATHVKYYLPDEEGVWEASWYQPGDGDFTPVERQGARIGMLICSELWALERARAYGQRGVHLLVSPRLTEQATTDKWLVAGRAAAILAGAFSLSSNRISAPGAAEGFGGVGWVIDPEGTVLALTSQQQPILSIEIPLRQAEEAKRSYPRSLFSPQSEG